MRPASKPPAKKFNSWQIAAVAVAGGLGLLVLFSLATGDGEPTKALHELEAIHYQYELLQRKKYVGEDWLAEAEPLQQRMEELDRSLLTMNHPPYELVGAVKEMSNILRSPKRPDPRLDALEEKLAAARSVIEGQD